MAVRYVSEVVRLARFSDKKLLTKCLLGLRDSGVVIMRHSYLTLFRPGGGGLPARILDVFIKQAKVTKLGDFSYNLSENNLV